MPTECPHGVILDWGDFGGPKSKRGTCEVCERRDEQRFADTIRDGLASYADPFAFEGMDLDAMSLHVARFIRSPHRAVSESEQ